MIYCKLWKDMSLCSVLPTSFAWRRSWCQKRLGYEIKYTDTPKITSSQRSALEHLRLDSLTIVCPGDASYPLNERIHVQGLANLLKALKT